MGKPQRAQIESDLKWDDLRFPLSASRIDTSSGRLDYNYFNCALGYQSNARYPNEPVCMLAQMQHSWKNGSAVRPHLHWIQQGSDEPNWLLAYKVVDNGASVGVETDFTNYTLLKKSSNAFTYVSGNLAQITIFPEIDMTGMSTSDMIQFVLFRDSANISGEFAGSDPSAITELALEFDIHYQKDDRGSQDEYTK